MEAGAGDEYGVGCEWISFGGGRDARWGEVRKGVGVLDVILGVWVLFLSNKDEIRIIRRIRNLGWGILVVVWG